VLIEICTWKIATQRKNNFFSESSNLLEGCDQTQDKFRHGSLKYSLTEQELFLSLKMEFRL